MEVKRLNMSPEDLARFEYTNYSNKKLEAILGKVFCCTLLKYERIRKILL